MLIANENDLQWIAVCFMNVPSSFSSCLGVSHSPWGEALFNCFVLPDKKQRLYVE
jgi:hypothetical protein